MTATPMYLRLVRRAVLGQSARSGMVLAAVALAATVTTALGSLQISLKGNLEKQLAAFGPNILVTGRAIPLSSLNAAAATTRSTLAPFKTRSVTVETVSGGARSARATATLEAIQPETQRPLASWWHVQGGWLAGPQDVMAGVDLAGALGVRPGDRVRLEGMGGESVVRGIVTTGGDEDRELFGWLGGTTADGAEVRAPGDAAHVETVAKQFTESLPGATVRVLQRVASADTLVLARLGAVFGLLGLVVVIAAGLCVATTFSTMVFQRSREIGLQKALGATNTEVVSLFWGEALCLGSVGSLVGYGLGLIFAAWIGASVFQASSQPEWVVFPVVLAASLGMTLAAAAPSARRIAGLEPAITLKGARSEPGR